MSDLVEKVARAIWDEREKQMPIHTRQGLTETEWNCAVHYPLMAEQSIAAIAAVLKDQKIFLICNDSDAEWIDAYARENGVSLDE